MSDYGAIAAIGNTLIELFVNNMKGLIKDDKTSIVLASPGEIEINEEVRLSLFLYQILENVYLKNQEMQIKGPATLKFPPIALDLYYMLTSYPSGKQDLTERTKDEHTVLGKAIQIINDNSILVTDNDELHITLNPVSLDEMTKMWTTFPGKPFRTSVCFLVTPVFIDSTHEYSVQRVTSKRIDSDIIAP
jgi:hypothetical protein